MQIQDEQGKRSDGCLGLTSLKLTASLPLKICLLGPKRKVVSSLPSAIFQGRTVKKLKLFCTNKPPFAKTCPQEFVFETRRSKNSEVRAHRLK